MSKPSKEELMALSYYAGQAIIGAIVLIGAVVCYLVERIY